MCTKKNMYVTVCKIFFFIKLYYNVIKLTCKANSFMMTEWQVTKNTDLSINHIHQFCWNYLWNVKKKKHPTYVSPRMLLASEAIIIIKVCSKRRLFFWMSRDLIPKQCHKAMYWLNNSTTHVHLFFSIPEPVMHGCEFILLLITFHPPQQIPLVRNS